MWSFFSRDPTKAFPYDIGDKVGGLESDQSIWSLHHGKQKSNGQLVSVFVFDVGGNSETTKQTALASLKRLKTLRHPNVITFIDSLETDKFIYMVTEPVMPLKIYLEKHKENQKAAELAVSWGLHQIVKGLSFLLNTVNLIHNNVCMSSMFTDAAGEWKLGGIDYMYPASGEGSNIPPIKTLPALEKYNPPEKRMKKSAKWSSDMWGLGCLIWETFNEELPRTSSLKIIGKIPKSLVRHYCELVSANPSSRPSPDKFLENCKTPNSFMSNHFVQANLFLEEIQIKEALEKTTFFNDLSNHLDEFPPNYSKHKILPQLLNVFQFGSGGPSVLPPLFKLGKLLDPPEYQAQIVPCVVKLFSSTDRATRIQLLRQLPLFVEHLQPAVVNSQVFPNMATGFMDTNPAIREQSVKGMLLLAPKLNENNLNNELMKHFARLQARDEQGPIRTNTTVCLGKMTPHFNIPTRHKVVSSAFARAMKDPFPAARIAGILAMCNNVQYFTTADCATRALPCLCSLTVDPDKQVRENAFKTIKVFLEKLQTASDNPEKADAMNQEAAAASQAGPSNTPGWTGWMSTGVTSLTSKLYASKVGSSKTQNQAKSSNSSKSSSVHPGTNAREKEIHEENKSTENPKQNKSLENKKQNEDDGGGGWDDGDWKAEVKDIERAIDCEFDSHLEVRKKKKKKLITTSQLRQMESEFWHELAENSKEMLEEEEEEEQDESYGGWENDTWSSNSPAQAKKKDADGWEDDTWSMDPLQEQNEESGWGGDWGAEDTQDLSGTKQAEQNPLPSSSYDWSQDAKETEHSFFNSFDSKPKKPASHILNSRKTQKPPAKKTTEPAAAPLPTSAFSSPHTDEWGSSGWDDGGWGGSDDGTSKTERLKQEREEKRRLRQKQLQEKRAAKAGNKLGSRKRD